MRKFFNKSDEKGTLLVEALAMLGLIAMVTPTLYKKSAERLQEIQDINAASQVRIMNSVVETLVRNNFEKLMNVASSAANETVELAYEDNTAGAFETGYSSYLPYGYTPNELRNYGTPKIYVHKDESRLVTYVVFPHIMNPGKKRASRLASLVGANGGIITDKKEAQGTGGAWYLDSTMVADIAIEDSVLTENSLIVTSNEPIENSMEDNDRYLYRVPPDLPDAESYHNTMVTDLFMGGHGSQEANVTPWGDYDAQKMHGIFNVRKLTLNTNCNYDSVLGGGNSSCAHEVADLYIGKPWANASDKFSVAVENEGAAWIYGNLSALSEGFRVWGNGSTSAEMVFRPSYEGSSAAYDVFFAKGDMSSSEVEVRMLDKFAELKKDSGNLLFRIASSMVGGADDELLSAQVSSNTGQQIVRVGVGIGSQIYVAPKGGEVYINSTGNANSSMVHAKTVINSGGGNLYAGSSDGAWLAAGGRGVSSRVEIMKDGGNYFTVGAGAGDTVVANPNNDFAEAAKIYVDFGTSVGNSSEVSLYGRRLKILEGEVYSDDSVSGGTAGASGVTEVNHGLTTISTAYTDIFGSIYLGNRLISSSDTGGAFYTRSSQVLGVAGNAWIDGMMWAREAWFNDAGFRNLHAGFVGTSSYILDEKRGWLNVYAPGDAKFARGAVVIRDPYKGVVSPYGNEDDIMFLASSGVAVMNDTEGAWAKLSHGEAQFGTAQNYFLATKSDSTVVGGSSYVVGGEGVHIYTKDDTNSSKVNLQKDALELLGHAGSDGKHENVIIARTGEYAVMLGSSAVGGIEDANIYANEDIVRTRYVDFEVQRDDAGTASSRVFGVYPNVSANGSANVEVNGSFHVTGNEVMHVASDEYNTASKDSSRAMFEVDPNYIRVWAKDKTNGNYGDGGSDYYALLSINPEDVSGSSIATTSIMDDTSVYIRKGAIELEESYGSNGENASTYEADEGYGYIKANRLVSNTGMVAKDITNVTGAYDQYMVNPAYTSVMHDIKLTTRGGARLSDVLPDFVLKGVYNISNDYIEGTKNKRIRWSAGDGCSRSGITCVSDDVAWADPYVGVIPFAMCPPGYKNMATMMPISFQLGRTGRMIKTNNEGTRAKWKLAEPVMQTKILAKALEEGDVAYPTMEETKSLYWNSIFQSSDTFSQFVASQKWLTEGWFWGLKAEHDKFGYLSSKVDVGEVNVYTDSDNNSYAVAEPLYFQEGTFLKTSLNPAETNGKGWAGRIGFLYDMGQYGVLHSSPASMKEGILSNNTDGTDNEDSVLGFVGNYFWNAFPVATNTLEGHATVYCYFDRTQFDGTNVLQFNSMSDSYNHKDKEAGSSDAYVKRLDDPSLKYSNPW